MRYGLKLAQRAPIEVFRAVWRLADEEGFDHLWNMDHFASVSGDHSGDVFEAWSLLAAMAEATSRVRIGCMVTGNTYRHPGVLAKAAVTVDHLSGGRLEFGLGAAWAEVEHSMLGLEFGTVRDRLERLEEACQIIRSLWTASRTTFDGRYYRLREAIAEPKPIQKPHPPIWIGGNGRRRTLRIVAEHADAWNATGRTAAEVADLSAALDEHCAAVGRDPQAIRRTIQLPVAERDDNVLSDVDDYAAVGVSDVILVLKADNAQADAERMAALLPRLRTID